MYSDICKYTFAFSTVFKKEFTALILFLIEFYRDYGMQRYMILIDSQGHRCKESMFVQLFYVCASLINLHYILNLLCIINPNFALL